MKRQFFQIVANFSGMVLLLSLLAAPFFFAHNFAKVAGVKSQSKFLLVSQIEKFPNLSLSQSADTYSITFQKQGPSQAFLGILIINNPTGQTQNYSLNVLSGNAALFFGEELLNQPISISVPSTASVPVSLFSSEEATPSSQTVEFRVQTQ